jgi:hypothetical protein
LWRELLRRYSEFRRKGISWRAKCQVFAPAVFNIHRAPQESVFFGPAVFYSRRTPCGCCVWRIFISVLLDRGLCTAKLLNSLSINPPKSSAPALRVLFLTEKNRIPPEQKLLCGKFSSYCKSRAKVHPDEHHFEKI